MNAMLKFKLFTAISLLFFCLIGQVAEATTPKPFQNTIINTQDDYHVHEVSYSISDSSQDKVYKQVTFHIIMENDFDDKEILVTPKFNKKFGETIYASDIVYGRLKTPNYENAVMIDVYVTFNSDNFDTSKFKKTQILKGLTIKKNNEEKYVKINENVPVTRID